MITPLSYPLMIIEVKPKLHSPIPPRVTQASTSDADPVSSFHNTSGNQDSTEWPRDYYVCDIVNCFKDCKTSVKHGGRKTRTLQVVFAEFFPRVDFKRSTYHDQRTFWLKASEFLKASSYEAGHKKAAKWSTFTAAVKKQRAAEALDNVVNLPN